MQDGMKQGDGVAVALGCGHNILKSRADGHLLCTNCDEDLGPIIEVSARAIEKDDQSGAENSGDKSNEQV